MADITPGLNGNEILLTQMKAYFSAVQDNLEQKQKDSIQSMMLELETLNQKAQSTVSKAEIEPIAKKMNEISEKMNQMAADAGKNQEVIDNFVKAQSQRTISEKKDFTSSWEEDVINGIKSDDFKKSYDNLAVGQKVKLKLRSNKMNLIDMEQKTVMTTSNTLTGTGLITFNERAGIVPAQKINFRDLLRTAQASNGSYVTYRETNTVQAPAKQSEGSAKANLVYTFSAVTATLAYIAGFATFTKQLLYNLPFMNGTLPTMLLRDFYKAENSYLFNTIASNSTGTSTPAGTSAKADAEELIQVIASQRGRNFNADYCIIDWTEWQRLLTTKPNDYSIPGGVIIDANGIIRIAGVPVVPAAWAQTDHALVYDQDFYERVEGESLNVTFSYENQDNFEKNQVTARIECFEEINRLRDDASVYYDFGNS